MKWKPPLLPCAQYIVNFSRDAFALTVKMPGLVSGIRRDRFSNSFAVKFCLSVCLISVSFYVHKNPDYFSQLDRRLRDDPALVPPFEGTSPRLHD